MKMVKRFFWTVCTQTFPFAQISFAVVALVLFMEYFLFKPNGKPTTG